MFCKIKCSKELPETAEYLDKNKVSRVDHLMIGDKVNIVAIISEKIVFVRRVSEDIVGGPAQIFKSSKESKKLEMFPEVGDLAIAKIDDELCRVKVLQVPDDETQPIFVQLIDYGNTARVSFDELLEMTPQCQAVKCAAIKVTLRGIEAPAINENIVDYLCGLKSMRIELSVTSLIDEEVELKNDVFAESINEKIMRLSKVPDATFTDESVSYEVIRN